MNTSPHISDVGATDKHSRTSRFELLKRRETTNRKANRQEENMECDYQLVVCPVRLMT